MEHKNREQQVADVLHDLLGGSSAGEGRKSESPNFTIEHCFQLIGLLTTDGTLVDANAAALSLVGASRDEVIGKKFWLTPWWAHAPEMQTAIRAAIQTAAEGEFVRFDASHATDDGKLRLFDFSLKPIFNDDGEVVYLVPEGRDVTEHRAREREREELLDQLQHNLAEGGSVEQAITICT